MKCREALELISLSVDGELDRRRERILRFHLNGCPSCRKALAMSVAISRAVARLPEPSPSPDLESRVMTRLSYDDYDTSPLPNPGRLRAIRRAAVILPFAATLVLAARVLVPRLPSDTSPPVLQAEEDYVPVPASAYTRPVTLTTF